MLWKVIDPVAIHIRKPIKAFKPYSWLTPDMTWLCSSAYPQAEDILWQ